MKIENIEKAYLLAKALQEMEKISEFEDDDIYTTSSIMLFYKNTRFNISSLLSEEQQKDLVKKIFWMIGDRAEKIKQEIEEL